MSGMNQELAALYGTPGADVSTEDMQKQAELELFAKLAADQGIDLNQLSDEQVEYLYAQTMGKQASDDKDADDKPQPPKKKEEGGDDEEQKKHSSAYAEWAEKRAEAEKWAEADQMGRIMAHAYVQELGLIGDQMNKEAAGEAGKASKVWGAVKGFAHKVRGGDVEALKTEARSAKGQIKALKRMSTESGSPEIRALAKEKADKALPELKMKHEANTARISNEQDAVRRARLQLAGGVGGVGALGVGGAALAHKKEASALDVVAAQFAVEKVASMGYATEQLVDELNGMLAQGVPESEKIASAGTYEDAVDVRALELLDALGYAVQY